MECEMRVGKRVAGAIKAKGLTQREVARRVGMTDQALSNRLNGRTTISIGEYLSLCKALDAHPAEFMEEATNGEAVSRAAVFQP